MRKKSVSKLQSGGRVNTNKEGQTAALPGYKLVKTRTANSPAKIKVGNAEIDNGIYTPKPVTKAKQSVPTKKTKWKAPSNRKTGMSKAMKTGGKGRKC